MKKKVLIIEDDLALLNTLRDTLTKENFEVLKAENGEQGLTVALREHPDLILLDIIMPVMDGLTMLRNLRGDAWGKDVKVILLSNLADMGKIKSEQEHSGVYAYITKSNINISDLVKMITIATKSQT